MQDGESHFGARNIGYNNVSERHRNRDGREEWKGRWDTERKLRPEEGTEMAYKGLQSILEDVAQGIEERPAEMERMAKDIMDSHAELMEVEKNIKRRQTLLVMTSREVKEDMLRVREEKQRMGEARARSEEPSNCTEVPVRQEQLEEKGVKVSGLKVVGVFTLCRVLAVLGWGGVTSVLVTTAKIWPTSLLALSEDASISMSELRPGGGKLSSRLAALSFKDKRARAEWPRRRTTPSRGMQSPDREDEDTGEAVEGGVKNIRRDVVNCIHVHCTCYITYP
jgi:hypothetical protein